MQNKPENRSLRYPVASSHTSNLLAAGFRIEKVEKGKIIFTRRIHRRGSVLVLVVVLLTLIALMGTAYLITTRTDRASSQQNTINTQVDLITDGVQQMVVSSIVRDITNGNANFALGYRSTVFVGGTPYQPYDCSTSNTDKDDLYLAERTPLDTFTAADGTTRSGTVNGVPFRYWPSISWPLSGTTFESPFFPPSTTSLSVSGNKNAFGFQIASWTDTKGNVRPAIYRISTADGSMSGIMDAADADGDGIADSGYCRIPGATIDGVTYYAAMRVVDLGSTLNVNTAWCRGQEYAFGAALPAPSGDASYLTSHIGLGEVLKNPSAGTPNDFTRLTSYRFAGMASLDATGNTAYNDTSHAGVAGMTFVSQNDALFQTLGRRVENPGYLWNTSLGTPAATALQAFPLTDTLTLATRFSVVSASQSSGTLEQKLTDSLVPPTGTPSTYSANQFATWYTNNFDYPQANTGDTTVGTGAASLRLRTMLSTRNPVANAVPVGDVSALPTDTTTWPPVANGDVVSTYPNHSIPLASVNTAPYSDLWRAYWLAFREAANARRDTTGTEITRVTDNRGDGMFRSTIREVSSAGAENDLQFGSMQLLRSALSAANAEAIRDGIGGNPPAHSFNTTARWYDPSTSTESSTPVTVTVFGVKPQPYISEIYACGEAQMDDTGVVGGANRNPSGYVAVELYNPYSFPIDVSTWRLSAVDRTTAQSGKRDPVLIATIPVGTPPIQPGNYMIIENFKGDATGEAKHRPVSSGLTPATSDDASWTVSGSAKLTPTCAVVVNVNGLGASLLGGTAQELLIERSSTSALFAPVDSFDFTGAGINSLSAGVPTNTSIWTYRRDETTSKWNVMYAGAYNVSASPRQSGTVVSLWNSPTLTPTTNEPTGLNASLGTVNGSPTVLTTRTMSLPEADGPSFTLGGLSLFPYGGFARLVDLLAVPYAGSYTIKRNVGAPNTIETNALPMDLIQADNNDPNENNLGRLCADAGFTCEVSSAVAATTTTLPSASLYTLPREVIDPSVYTTNILTNGGYEVQVTIGANTEVRQVTGFAVDNTNKVGVVTVSPAFSAAPTGTFKLQVRYTGFASRLLDGFTVLQSPNEDYLPATPGLGSSRAVAERVPNGPQVTTTVNANNHNEDTTPIHGLININTASWRVLSMVPWVPETVANHVYVNEQIARAIVNDRMANGPFRTLTDLYRVKAFRSPLSVDTGNGQLLDFGPTAGSIPNAPVSWGNYGGATAPDYVKRYILLDRVSNMITTRSDGFIVYLLVQGYRNAGTADAYLEAQRRLAFYVDRSAVTPSNPTPTVIQIPTR